jgi:hypothetical protein
MYPPLAGKHLQVIPVDNDLEIAFDVVAMGKEVVRVSVSSQAEREAWIHHLHETIEFGRQGKPRFHMYKSFASPAELRADIDNCGITK